MPIGDKLLGIVHKITEETNVNVMQPLIENLKKVEKYEYGVRKKDYR